MTSAFAIGGRLARMLLHALCVCVCFCVFPLWAQMRALFVLRPLLGKNARICHSPSCVLILYTQYCIFFENCYVFGCETCFICWSFVSHQRLVQRRLGPEPPPRQALFWGNPYPGRKCHIMKNWTRKNVWKNCLGYFSIFLNFLNLTCFSTFWAFNNLWCQFL